MRGIISITSAVPLSLVSPSGLPSGFRKQTSVVPAPSFAASSSDGGATLTTTSALHGSPIVAPTAVYASSVAADSAPAPASTMTSCSAATSRRTTSGTSATRRSPAAVSFGTPIFTGRGTQDQRAATARRDPGSPTHPCDGQRLARERHHPRRVPPHGRLAARARIVDLAVGRGQRAQVGEGVAPAPRLDSRRVPARREQ